MSRRLHRRLEEQLVHVAPAPVLAGLEAPHVGLASCRNSRRGRTPDTAAGGPSGRPWPDIPRNQPGSWDRRFAPRRGADSAVAWTASPLCSVRTTRLTP